MAALLVSITRSMVSVLCAACLFMGRHMLYFSFDWNVVATACLTYSHRYQQANHYQQ
ncbi:hypothetical protein [Dyadobacter sp. MSC1_007]|uniref:hypothetical protein n=1 Tax=Dyadobacter sp. MSC1_007 TaxID=2909264 RepID=UPI00202FC13D|nr:hypothetical protein [Dyadobacter sp. MSC1_007]